MADSSLGLIYAPSKQFNATKEVFIEIFKINIKEKHVSIIIMIGISADLLIYSIVTLCALDTNALHPTVNILTIKSNNFIIQADIRLNFANSTQTIYKIVNTNNFVHLLILHHRLWLTWFISRPRIIIFMYKSTKQFGVHSLKSNNSLSIVMKEASVRTLITFKTLEEIQINIVMTYIWNIIKP